MKKQNNKRKREETESENEALYHPKKRQKTNHQRKGWGGSPPTYIPPNNLNERKKFGFVNMKNLNEREEEEKKKMMNRKRFLNTLDEKKRCFFLKKELMDITECDKTFKKYTFDPNQEEKEEEAKKTESPKLDFLDFCLENPHMDAGVALKRFLMIEKLQTLQKHKDMVEKIHHFFQKKNRIDIKQFLSKLGCERLKYFCNTYFQMGMDDVPTLLTHLVDLVYSKLFHEIPPIERRKFEEGELLIQQQDDRFFCLKGRVIPKEIMLLMTSFMIKNKAFLDSVGLINEKWYLLALTSWKKVFVTKKNIYLIPTLVLNTAECVHFCIEDSVYVKEIKYIQSRMKRANILVIKQNVKKFFKFLKNDLNVRALKIHQRYFDGKTKLRNMYLSKLKDLEISTDFGTFGKLHYQDVYQKLIYLKFNRTILHSFTLPMKMELPSWMGKLQNLRVLHITSFPGNLNVIGPLKGLQELALGIDVQSDFVQLNKYVFSNLCALKMLKLLFFGKMDHIYNLQNALKDLYQLKNLVSIYLKYEIFKGIWDTLLNVTQNNNVFQWKKNLQYFIHLPKLKNMKIKILIEKECDAYIKFGRMIQIFKNIKTFSIVKGFIKDIIIKKDMGMMIKKMFMVQMVPRKRKEEKLKLEFNPIVKINKFIDQMEKKKEKKPE